MISDYGLSKNFLPGWVGKSRRFIHMLTYLHLVQGLKGFWKCLAEAKMYGIPCVSFNCISGPKDIINNGFDGFLVKPENYLDMANSLKTLMSNSKLREEISKNAVAASDEFSVSTIMRKWDNTIYSKG